MTKGRTKGADDPPPIDVPLSVLSDVEAGSGSAAADYVADGFRALQEASDAQARGYDFEELARRLFVFAGFETTRNPPISSPRQTDLGASKGDLTYVVELRWRQESVDIGDIDALQARLARAPRGTIGCIFAMSAATEAAIARVERLRASEAQGFEILLFQRAETEAIFLGVVDLDNALAHKLKTLRNEGKVGGIDIPEPKLQPLDIPLPRPRWKLWREGRLVRSTVQQGSHENFGFAMWMFYSMPTEGTSFSLDFSPPVHTLADLRSLLELLHSRLRLTRDGAYNICQSNASWGGYGASHFLAEVADLENRYRGVPPEMIHHSEELTYFDTMPLGVVAVTARRSTRKTDELFNVRVEFKMAGLPLDSAPLLSLAKTLGYAQAAFKASVEPVARAHYFNPPLSVEPREYVITSEGSELIAGLAVANPFSEHKWDGLKEVFGDSDYYHLLETDLILGTLNDWLAPSEVVDELFIRRIERTKFQESTAFSVWLQHGPIVGTRTPSVLPIGRQLPRGKHEQPEGNRSTRRRGDRS